MDFGINGKTALITGGASGIGLAIATDLAKEGVSVFITSRHADRLDEALNILAQATTKSHQGMVCELTDTDGPKKLYEHIAAKFGNIDIVVNNIGDTLNIVDPYCSLHDWRRVFRLNLEVTIEINNYCIPYMKQQDWGRIINITAGAAMENSGPVPYCSIKAAATAYTRSMGRILAIEAKNVVMSAVLPGVVLTEYGHWQKVLQERPEHAEKYLKERTPLGRFGTPNEISPMVVFLASKYATFCHGSIVPVDAGQAKHYFSNWVLG